MKIAVTYDNGNVMQHFGRTEKFLLCTADNGVITSSEIVDTQGRGHGMLPPFLKAHGVDVVICGGLGAPMKTAVEDLGMQLVYGVQGDAAEAAKKYLEGTLQGNPDAIHAGCTHHHS